MTRSSRFKAAVGKCRQLSWHSGLAALSRADRERLRVADARRLTGSLNLDADLRASDPEDARWDYGVGFEHEGSDERVHWIEVHPATQREVSRVLSKLSWLRAWLRSQAALQSIPCCFVWVSSGRTALSPAAPERRRLAKNGLILAGSHYRLY